MKHSSTLYVDTPVYVPEIEDEAIRDLSQARERLIFQLSPDWSPVQNYGGYGAPLLAKGPAENASPRSVCLTHGHGGKTSYDVSHVLWDALGCDCFVC
jgi:hypothetical protein